MYCAAIQHHLETIVDLFRLDHSVVEEMEKREKMCCAGLGAAESAPWKSLLHLSLSQHLFSCSSSLDHPVKA